MVGSLMGRSDATAASAAPTQRRSKARSGIRLSEPYRRPYMVQRYITDYFVPRTGYTAPAAFPVKRGDDLGAGLRIGNPELSLRPEGGQHFLHDHPQLLLVDSEDERKIDLLAFQQWGEILGKGQLDELFLDGGRKTLDQQVPLIGQL